MISTTVFIDQESRWRVSNAHFAFGGVSKTTLSAVKTEESIVGFEWDGQPDALFEKLRLQLLEEIHIPTSAPGGMAEFRMSLVSSFVFKFIVAISNQILPDAVRLFTYSPGYSWRTIHESSTISVVVFLSSSFFKRLQVSDTVLSASSGVLDLERYPEKSQGDRPFFS